jgi:hypothetical protein
MLFVAAPAYADHASWHATLSGDLATTDNVFSAPVDQYPNGDVFTTVRPGMLFAYDAPRMIHELNAEIEFLEYVLHSDRPSVTGRAGWKGFFLPGPRSELLLTANGSRGQLNALSSRSSPDQTGIGVLPSSTAPIDVSQADAGAYLSWQSSKATRLSDQSFARWTATDDNQMTPTTTDVREVGTTGTFSYAWRSDSLGLDAGASYLRLLRIAPPTAMPGSMLQRQINPHAMLVWQHDVDKHWSTNVDGGVVYVNPVGTDPYNPGLTNRAAPFPIFGAVVAYTETWGRATVAARRAVTPNLFIALNTVDDSLTSQLALPLPWFDDNPHARTPKFVGLGSLGIEHAQLVDPTMDNKLTGSIYVARADVGIAWMPQPGQSWGLRYEFVYQHGDASTAMVTPSFFRNTLYFTFSLRYPDRLAAAVPRRTQSVRADRKDLSPVGAEPVVPDPTEQLPDEDSSPDDR